MRNQAATSSVPVVGDSGGFVPTGRDPAGNIGRGTPPWDQSNPVDRPPGAPRDREPRCTVGHVRDRGRDASRAARLRHDASCRAKGCGALRRTTLPPWPCCAAPSRSVWTFFDTADSYGPEVAEDLLRDALHPYADDVVIATKAGLTRQGPGVLDAGGPTPPTSVSSAALPAPARRGADRPVPAAPHRRGTCPPSRTRSAS